MWRQECNEVRELFRSSVSKFNSVWVTWRTHTHELQEPCGQVCRRRWQAGGLSPGSDPGSHATTPESTIDYRRFHRGLCVGKPTYEPGEPRSSTDCIGSQRTESNSQQ